MRRLAKKGSDLRSFTLDSIQNSLESRLTETTLDAGLFIIRKSGTQPLGTVVKSVPKRFVDTLDRIPASHEDLSANVNGADGIESRPLTRSNAVEHARGCVATKMGFCDIFAATSLQRVDNRCYPTGLRI